MKKKSRSWFDYARVKHSVKSTPAHPKYYKIIFFNIDLKLVCINRISPQIKMIQKRYCGRQEIH